MLHERGIIETDLEHYDWILFIDSVDKRYPLAFERAVMVGDKCWPVIECYSEIFPQLIPTALFLARVLAGIPNVNASIAVVLLTNPSPRARESVLCMLVRDPREIDLYVF